MGEQKLMGGRPACRVGSAGRDVAPRGADVRVSRDTRRVSGIQSPTSLRDFRGPRAMPVGLHGHPKVIEQGTVAEAVRAAAELAAPGTTVLFSPACASFDMFRNFEERGRAFKAAVKALEAE